MAEHNANQDSSISGSLHPLVNIAIIGLVLMFVAAVWMFFDSGPYEAWLDVVVTGLFVIAIAIPALLWLTWRRNADDARDDSHLSFRDWAVGDFDTLTGPVKGANATAEVLLPIAAVAVGMMVLGLVWCSTSSPAAPLDTLRQAPGLLVGVQSNDFGRDDCLDQIRGQRAATLPSAAEAALLRPEAAHYHTATRKRCYASQQN
jgi:hypothetical protein